ncbi:MAG: uracil-xanthine permease family protein [Actinomycetia bacterium]|nr:uracil-xanthine permease family protein [Actinomycetes bacterium]
MQKKSVLGLQHVVAMFGATVLVPLLTGLNPSVALLAAGVGTLLFHLVTKRMVPVFLGSSFAFIPAIIIATERGYSWAGIGLGIMGAGVLYLLMSALVAVVGHKVIQRIFPPIVTGPVIIVIGITLAPVAISMSEGAWWLALITTATVIVAAVFFKGLFRMLPILTGAVVGYILAIFFFEGFSFQPVLDAAWVGLPEFTWGLGDLSWAPIALIAPIAFVTMIEHVGDIMANGNVVGKDFFDEPGLNRTLLGDGIATLFAGLIGGPPNTTYSENTGVLAVTKVYDPLILRIGAGFAIFLALIPKLAAVLRTVPVPVLGGLSVVLFGMIAAVGLRTLVTAQVDFSKSRNMIVVGLILVFGLGISGLQSALAIGDVPISGLALAAVLGVIINLVLPLNEDEDEQIVMASEAKTDED